MQNSVRKETRHLIATITISVILLTFVTQFNKYKDTMYSLWPSNYGATTNHDIVFLTQEFLVVALESALISTVIGMLIGGFVFTKIGRDFKDYFDRISSILYAIPSVAIIMIFLNVFGFGKTTGIIAIVIQAVLPIISTTYSGISSVDESIIDVANGLGMSSTQIFFKVQLPIALPIILSGIRVSIIMCVSSTTLAYQAGAGGLGKMIFSGFTTYDFVSIFAGTFPICLIALICDQLFKYFEAHFKYISKGGGIQHNR